jgi:tRNA modification GTPase
MTEPTIVALATARGKSAIAIVRISGPATRFVLETVTGLLPQPRVATLRQLKDGGDVIDHGLAIWFPGPMSYTGEDCAEFHLHGGAAVINKLLTRLLSLDGVRLAEAGEFTKRAVLNDKLDLASAEAVSDLISAETEVQRKHALSQLDGNLTRACEDWQSRLIGALAHIESSLDFSDEGDVPANIAESARGVVQAVIDEIDGTLAQSNYGERIREGFRVAILGAPNAGKSTLINRLSKRDIAIVTAIAGTTRDSLEVSCDIDGLPIIFIDTAGLRDSRDPIEQLGIERSKAHAEQADLILWLQAPGTDDHTEVNIDLAQKPHFIVGTKSDLNVPYARATDVTISAHAKDGIDQLLSKISHTLNDQVSGQVLINRQRHRTALEQAREPLLRALTILHEEELFAEDVRLAIRSIGRIVGTVDIDRVLDRIFSEFCIGK